jgi:hypothetical protein
MAAPPEDNTDICKNCGAILPYKLNEWPRDILKICPACGFSLKGSSRWGSRKGGLRTDKKNTVLAAVLSLIWPGLGQAYNEDFLKAALVFVPEMIGLAYTPVILISIVAIVAGMADAYRSSKNMNIGNIPYKETRRLHLVIYIGATLAIGIIIFRITGNPLRFF